MKRGKQRQDHTVMHVMHLLYMFCNLTSARKARGVTGFTNQYGNIEWTADIAFENQTSSKYLTGLYIKVHA
jgi:hypothetical protein